MATNNVVNLKGPMPRFSVVNYTTQDNTTNPYTVQFLDVLFDITSSFNTGTGIFTAPMAGYYQLGCSMAYNPTGGAPTALYIVTTGGSYACNVSGVAFGGNCVAYMAASDMAYVQLLGPQGTIYPSSSVYHYMHPNFYGVLLALV